MYCVALPVGLVWSHWIRAFIEEHDMLWAVAGLMFMVILAVLLCSRLVPPWWHAVQSGKKAAVPSVVRSALGAMILLDALIVSAHHPIGCMWFVFVVPGFFNCR